jgi:hypothetical protein
VVGEEEELRWVRHGGIELEERGWLCFKVTPSRYSVTLGLIVAGFWAVVREGRQQGKALSQSRLNGRWSIVQVARRCERIAWYRRGLTCPNQLEYRRKRMSGYEMRWRGEVRRRDARAVSSLQLRI